MFFKEHKMEEKEVFCLYQELSQLTDRRRDQGKRHPIELVVTIIILAVMNNFNGLRSAADFVKRYSLDLIDLFKPNKNRLPSYSTIQRTLNYVDFDELNKIFFKWTGKNISIDKEEWISLDGKEIRGSTISKEDKFINIISLFFVNKKQVFMMGKVKKKSNEIPKVQELIKNFPEEGMVYRLDALHCQKKTIEVILSKKSYYVLEAKNNQKKLLKKIKFITNMISPISSNITIEKNRGRIETRKVTIYKDYMDLYSFGWTDVTHVIKVERKVVHKNGKISNEIAYFITNLNKDAEYFNKNIRSHWRIENSLHYIKDVVFKEDHQKLRTGQAPQNMSLIISLVMNIFRKIGCTNIIQTLRLNSGKIDEMVKLLDIKTLGGI